MPQVLLDPCVLSQSKKKSKEILKKKKKKTINPNKIQIESHQEETIPIDLRRLLTDDWKRESTIPTIAPKISFGSASKSRNAKQIIYRCLSPSDVNSLNNMNEQIYRCKDRRFIMLRSLPPNPRGWVRSGERERGRREERNDIFAWVYIYKEEREREDEWSWAVHEVVGR